jgi:hypothetical protein
VNKDLVVEEREAFRYDGRYANLYGDDGLRLYCELLFADDTKAIDCVHVVLAGYKPSDKGFARLSLVQWHVASFTGLA